MSLGVRLPPWQAQPWHTIYASAQLLHPRSTPPPARARLARGSAEEQQLPALMFFWLGFNMPKEVGISKPEYTKAILWTAANTPRTFSQPPRHSAPWGRLCFAEGLGTRHFQNLLSAPGSRQARGRTGDAQPAHHFMRYHLGKSFRGTNLHSSPHLHWGGNTTQLPRQPAPHLFARNYR